jgi:hypothetical protein
VPAIPGVQADPSAWRSIDWAGLALVEAARVSDAGFLDLYLRGDREEKVVLLRAVALRPVGSLTARLLEEVQRTNQVVHVEAAWLDHDLLARALEARQGFGPDAFSRAVLKMAFLDLPLARAFRALDHATPTLSALLQEFASEREAAGRPIWADTLRVLGRAPAPGSEARLLGGLEHGSDPMREAAIRGLLDLVQRGPRPDLAAHARARLPREPLPTLRALLEALAGGPGNAGRRAGAP